MLMQKMCKYLPYYKRIRVFCVSVRDTRISTLTVVVRSLRYVLLIALSLRRYLHIFLSRIRNFVCCTLHRRRAAVLFAKYMFAFRVSYSV